LELSRRCGIFLLDLGTVPTVWYFSVRSWNCPDGVVFFVFHFISEVESFQKRIGKALSIKCFN